MTARNDWEKQTTEDRPEGTNFNLTGSGLKRYTNEKTGSHQRNVVSEEQSTRAGVDVGTANKGAGGIAGFFDPNAKVETQHFTAGRTNNTSLPANKARVDALAREAAMRGTQTMRGAQVGPASQIDTLQQNQMRARQNALLDQLAQTAAGGGPSAAQQMFKAGADRAQAAALARAAAGGTAGAQRQASFEAAGAIQDAAGQSAMLRAQEQQQAMGMLGGTLQGARQQDLGLAVDQAQLNQQALLTQAGLNQQTQQTNLIAGVDQQKQKDALIQQYVSQGIALDQANYLAQLQQAQFNADLLARQAAADQGVAAQSSASGGQTLGAIATTAGTIAAAASDERVKENVADGDKSVEKFLDGIAAKDWDYKNPAKHGEGRRTGIMAQDAEKHSDMVFTHTDGVKMLDLGKATSTALASLANINKRLRKLEK